MDTVSGTVSIKWIDGTLMAGMDTRNRPIVIGGATTHDQVWQGVKPSDLLLMAAASCSLYDVITILTKQREPVEKLDVICTGEQLKEAPYRFVSLHLHYIVKGKINPEKLARAIELSEEKYCSVITTLKSSVKVTSDFEVLDSATQP
jgi:putative redox protein